MFRRHTQLTKGSIALFLIFILTQTSVSFAEEAPLANSKMTDLDLISLSSRNSSIAAKNLSISVTNSLNFINNNDSKDGIDKDNAGYTTAKDTVRAMREAAASAKKSALITRETASLIMKKSTVSALQEKEIENKSTHNIPTQEEIKILITEASEKISIAAKKAIESAERASKASELETAIEAANETASSTEETIKLFEDFQDVLYPSEVIVLAPSCDDEESLIDKWICEMRGNTM